LASGLLKIKKFLVDPPAPADRSAGPTRGLQAKTQKPIGSLGHDLDFVAIGKLGNALDFRTIGNLGNDMHFVTIGNLGNCSDIAKIANDFGWFHASGAGRAKSPKSLAILARLSCQKS
jgi:hypothetical protein